ncbi:ABC transporter permease subunit [Devosia sp.]|uniref:ABC transporter permease subunit n=1 Tax=Devosia sp. TaxID=1871048 RepID=UPI003A8CA61E
MKLRLPTIIGLGLVALVVVAAIAALFAPLPVGTPFAPPDGTHLLGTDQTGRDLLQAVLGGAMTTLVIAGLSALAGLLLGGAMSGLALRLCPLPDAGTIAPRQGMVAIIAGLVLAGLLGPGMANAVIAIGISVTLGACSELHLQLDRMRQLPYVQAARAAGLPTIATVQRHLMPELLPWISALALRQLAVAVLLEVALSFAGLGVTAPAMSLGSMMTGAQTLLTLQPLLAVLPGALAFGIAAALFLAAAGFSPRPGRGVNHAAV